MEKKDAMKYSLLSLSALVFLLGAAPDSPYYTLKASDAPKILTVKESISLALTNNLELKKIANKTREAHAKVHVNAGKLVPDLSAHSSYNAEPGPKEAKAQLQLKVPLIDSKSWASLKSSRESLSAAELKFA